MHNEYDYEPVADATENTDAQPVEENEEGIELTDTTPEQGENEGVKTYTEEDLERLVNERVNEILPNKIEREKRKIEKTYRDKLANYEETESILKAGLGTKDIIESNQKMREFYKEQGVDIPTYQQPKYSDDDERALGELEASKIIKLGYDEMEEEANRLAEIGTNNMTVRDKAMFTALTKELKIQKDRKELLKIGAPKEILEDFNFRQFSDKFTREVPMQDIYDMYQKFNNKEPKKYDQIGSLKNNKEPIKRDYYSNEEIAKMSPEEIRKNFDIIRKSMTGQTN